MKQIIIDRYLYNFYRYGFNPDCSHIMKSAWLRLYNKELDQYIVFNKTGYIHREKWTKINNFLYCSFENRKMKTVINDTYIWISQVLNKKNKNRFNDIRANILIVNKLEQLEYTMNYVIRNYDLI